MGKRAERPEASAEESGAGRPEDGTGPGAGGLGPCPTCGARVLPVVYGMPEGPVFEAADRGELVIGGCVIDHFPMASHVCAGQPGHDLMVDRRGRLVPAETWDEVRDGWWDE